MTAAATKSEAIQAAAEGEWPFEDWQFTDKNGEQTLSCLYGQADGWLTGGESEEEFSECLARAIWQANGEFCKVDVTAVYLEELPYRCYCFARDEYDKLMTTADE